MFLAVIMYCSALDVTSCEVLLRSKGGFFTIEEACEEEIATIGNGLVEEGYFVKAKCFELESDNRLEINHVTIGEQLALLKIGNR